MSILLAAFEGSNNSAKVILDNLAAGQDIKKLYLKNNRQLCVGQLIAELEKRSYDFILTFGQKPVIKDKIYIETEGRSKDRVLVTRFAYLPMQEYLNRAGFTVKISENAGTSFCNHIYYHGLEYLEKNLPQTRMIFLHIPFLNNISDVVFMAKAFNGYIETLT